VGPSPGAADRIFPGKKLATFLVIAVCQLSVLFFSSLSLLLISLVHSGVAHYFRHVAMLQKKFAASLVGPLFVGATIRPNMLNMPKSAAAHNRLVPLVLVLCTVILLEYILVIWPPVTLNLSLLNYVLQIRQI